MSSFWTSLFFALALSIGLLGASSGTPLAYAEDVATTTDQGVETTIATSTDGTGGQLGGTIITGDATASTTVENELNTNIASDVDSPGEANSSHIVASTTNEATVEAVDSTEAATGENQAGGGESLATVDTGNAVATANVINVVNTNIFNSQGLILFLNQLFGVGFDLRNFNLSYFFDGEAGASPTVNESTGEAQCTLLTCLNSSSLNVVNDSTATVTNSVIVRAATGENTASSTENGGASIETGDAYASANVLNLVNTNIINSSYLLVSFNNFGDLAGDITLPNADFFGKLLAHGGAMPALNSSTYGVNNTNNVDFTGTTTASAITGENVASTTGAGAGEVTTGDAYSSATTFTDANSNYFGGTSVLLFFRVSGIWSGSVMGLPAGMSWTRIFENSDTSSSTVIMVTSDNSGVELPEAPDANCDKYVRDENNNRVVDENGEYILQPVSNCFNSSSFLASSTNIAVVENDIEVSAETGANETLTENGASTIATGDAYAVANVVNLINTNIVGRNWIFAVFNVFGDWSGDVSFGQSDLELHATTDATGPLLPGSTVVYQFVVTNGGDADAEGVLLKADFDKSLLTFGTESGAIDTDTGKKWSLGDIARGETHTFMYTAQVGAIPAGTSMTVPLTATIENSTNGTPGVSVLFTVVTVDVASPPPPAPAGGGGGGGGGIVNNNASSNTASNAPSTSSKNPDISVIKTSSVGTLSSTTIDYQVVVTNKKDAGPAYQGRLTDTLYNPSGDLMYTRSWELDTIAPGDQITLTYTVDFGTSTKPGAYHNVARVTGLRNGSTAQNGGVEMTPVEGSRDVTLVSSSGEGLVLGAQTGGSCLPILSTFLRRGTTNNADEVKKLQQFLNSDVGTTLPTTGFFGPLTQTAVKMFQKKYAAEVLAPLGISTPTGAVYTMTQGKINQLACGGVPVAALFEPQQHSAVAPSVSSAPKLKKPVAPKIIPAALPASVAAPSPTPKQTGWFSALKGLFGGF